MSETSENVLVPAGQSAPEDARQSPEPASEHPDRLMEPLACGEPVPFDPELYQPSLTPEELEEMEEDELPFNLGTTDTDEADELAPKITPEPVLESPVEFGEPALLDPAESAPLLSEAELNELEEEGKTPDLETATESVANSPAPAPIVKPPVVASPAAVSPNVPTPALIVKPPTASPTVPAPASTVPAAPPPPPGPSPLELESLRNAAAREDQAAVQQHLLTLGVDKKLCARILTAWEVIATPGVPRPQRLASMQEMVAAIRHFKGAAKIQDELWRLQRALTKYT